MSLWNWGSVTPKLPPWRKRIQLFHCADGARRADQGQDEGEADVDPPGVGPHELLVAPHQLVLLGQDDVMARDAVAHHEVHPQHGEEDRPEDAEEPELDRQQRREDVVQVDRGEPEAVGVEPGQRAQRHQQNDDDDDEADQPPPGPVATARRGVSGQVAGDAHEGSLTSAAPPPLGSRGRQKSWSVGRRRDQAPAARVAPADGRAPWGTPRSPATAPASALSSQSEHPVGGRHAPSAPCRSRWPRPRPPRRPAWPGRPPVARRARPCHSRKAAPMRSAGSPAPFRHLPAQAGHHDTGQPRRRLLHGITPWDGRRPGPDEHRAGGERLVEVAARRRGEGGQVLVLGAHELVDLERRRAAQAVEQPVLVVAQVALDGPAELGGDRREQLVRAAR